MGFIPALSGAGSSAVEKLGERTAEGIVVELLPSALVRVRLEGEHQLIAHFPSTQRANFVRLRVGDRVRVAHSVQDPTRGRVLEILAKG